MAAKKQGNEIEAIRKDLRIERRNINGELDYIKKHIDKLWEEASDANNRLQELEVQVNLLSRLVTTLAMENMKIRLSELRKIIRRIEKEAIADSEIYHLESLFKLERPQSPNKESKILPPENS